MLAAGYATLAAVEIRKFNLKKVTSPTGEVTCSIYLNYWLISVPIASLKTASG